MKSKICKCGKPALDAGALCQSCDNDEVEQIFNMAELERIKLAYRSAGPRRCGSCGDEHQQWLQCGLADDPQQSLCRRCLYTLIRDKAFAEAAKIQDSVGRSQAIAAAMDQSRRSTSAAFDLIWD